VPDRQAERRHEQARHEIEAGRVFKFWADRNGINADAQAWREWEALGRPW
jgi:hypothetical protein